MKFVKTPVAICLGLLLAGCDGEKTELISSPLGVGDNNSESATDFDSLPDSLSEGEVSVDEEIAHIEETESVDLQQSGDSGKPVSLFDSSDVEDQCGPDGEPSDGTDGEGGSTDDTDSGDSESTDRDEDNVTELGSGLVARDPAAIDVRGYTEVMRRRNDLNGTLAGRVFFVQSQSASPNNADALNMPDIVSEREVLFAFEPDGTAAESYQLIVNRNGSRLFAADLLPPSQLPQSNQPIEHRGELKVEFSRSAWHARIPWRHVGKGIDILVQSSNGSYGTIEADELSFGPPLEAHLTAIRVGLLTDYDESPTHFETSPSAAAGYFATSPVAKVIVSHYEPVKLDKVVLRDGTTYTDASASEGGVFTGDMREQIAKFLISQGINQANYGRNDSYASRQAEAYHRYLRFTAHRAQGNYANGIKHHGFSGGDGMGTLFNFIGNELSHELGHSLKLGHYPGGKLSIQGPHYGWGFSPFHDAFVSNLRWDSSSATAYQDNFSQPPLFGKISYNKDAMAGGYAQPMVDYTLYSGYSAKLIQNSNVAMQTIDRGASGVEVHRWDAEQQKMVAVDDDWVPEFNDIPVTTVVGFYDPNGELPTTIYPALHGNRGAVYPQAQVNGGWCRLEVSASDGEKRFFPLSARRQSGQLMNSFHVNLDGRQHWNRAEVHCGVSAELLADWMGVGKIYTEWKANDTGAKAGDIYMYGGGVSARLYRLKDDGSYWYFPTQPGVDNQWWEYIGTAHEYGLDHFERCVVPKRAIAHELGVDEIGQYWLGTDPQAGIGHVTSYVVDGQRLYFRQKRADTWYLPTAATSNFFWEYVGEHNALYAAQCDNGSAGERVVGQALQAAKGTLPAPVVVGREAGFTDVYNHLPDYADAGLERFSRVRLSLDDLRQFEQGLIGVYGGFVDGAGAGLKRVNTGQDLSYQLKNDDGTREIIRFSDVAEVTPNPVAFATNDETMMFSSLDQAVAFYHGYGTMKVIGESVVAGDTLKVGSDGDAHYYLVLEDRDAAAATDANSWLSIGAASQLSISDYQPTPATDTTDDILQRMLQWAEQADFGVWVSDDNTTPAGTVFHYQWNGYESFYMTRNGNGDYHYFPTNQASNNKWIHIGSFPQDW